MNRTKVISIILNNSELFNKQELHSYSDEQLYATVRTLFLSIRSNHLKINIRTRGFLISGETYFN